MGYMFSLCKYTSTNSTHIILTDIPVKDQYRKDLLTEM